mmetsp:Transcript_7303/g.24260  ORF Transcript_7303/g.24260 Transcript_7303/m.24260 type:complete len:330 (+) Transcript_7303:3872-4861(+)
MVPVRGVPRHRVAAHRDARGGELPAASGAAVPLPPRLPCDSILHHAAGAAQHDVGLLPVDAEHHRPLEHLHLFLRRRRGAALCGSQARHRTRPPAQLRVLRQWLHPPVPGDDGRGVAALLLRRQSGGAVLHTQRRMGRLRVPDRGDVLLHHVRPPVHVHLHQSVRGRHPRTHHLRAAARDVHHHAGAPRPFPGAVEPHRSKQHRVHRDASPQGVSHHARRAARTQRPNSDVDAARPVRGDDAPRKGERDPVHGSPRDAPRRQTRAQRAHDRCQNQARARIRRHFRVWRVCASAGDWQRLRAARSHPATASREGGGGSNSKRMKSGRKKY